MAPHTSFKRIAGNTLPAKYSHYWANRSPPCDLGRHMKLHLTSAVMPWRVLRSLDKLAETTSAAKRLVRHVNPAELATHVPCGQLRPCGGPFQSGDRCCH